MEHTPINNPTHELIHPANNFRKSCSSIHVGYMGNGRILRESHSFTDGIQENYKMQQDDKEDDLSSDKDSNKENSVFYIWTKQINSFEPFMVFEEMLTFQGKKYSQSDIAPIWKKDCRMWLWKTKEPIIQKKVKGSFMKKFKKLKNYHHLPGKKIKKRNFSHVHYIIQQEFLFNVLVKLTKLRLV